jgi:hypothetical protein
MDTTDLLITATAVGPALATVVTPGFTSAVSALARRVKHIEVKGADLFRCGVPMTETQFREFWAAFQGALDELPPPRERSEWDMKRQFEAAQRLAVLAGTHPHAFPNFGNPDQAWEWDAENNPYATGGAPGDPLTPGGRRAAGHPSGAALAASPCPGPRRPIARHRRGAHPTVVYRPGIRGGRIWPPARSAAAAATSSASCSC